jgi:phage terminase large subunit
MVEFMGADDEQKIRGRKRDILYCNEANELKYNEEFFQLLIRTEYKTFIDFNPDDEQIRINVELEQKRKQDK